MKRVLILLGMVLCMTQGHAQNHPTKPQQNALDKFMQSAEKEFDDFNKQNEEEYDRFRQQAMKDFVAFVRNPWKEFEETKPVPLPKEEPVPPVVMPKEDKDKPVKDNPVIILDIVKPAPIEPQPTPITPIREIPVVQEKTVNFIFFGTSGKVRFDTANRIMLNRYSEKDIANALNSINPKNYDNMLIDCLALRKNLRLSDWGYLQMLKALCDRVCGQGTNEGALMLAYLYMQSGYKMRLATSGSKLYMLYASKHQIFNQCSFGVKGDVFYGVEELPSRLNICEASFPKEKELSLLISGDQQFTKEESSPRTIVSERYKNIKVTVSVNKNLIEFYNTYPTSMINDNFMTRWAMYANTPLDETIKKQAYPALKEQLKGLSQIEAANRLLDFVQTGFVYEYDNKVWGRDRAFFAEESLYYPYCDCEDRSILFSRLVRDLMGLDCILIYYPGHLAAAVAFTENVSGDYIMLNGRKFVVSDPTYIGAPVGKTMPNMDNKSATVILL